MPAQQNKLAIGPPREVALKRGAETTAPVRVEVQPGFHVNSNHPKDEFLIPLKLTWTSGPLQTQSVLYPKPEEIQVGNETLSVFTGEFNVETQFRAPTSAPTGPATMTGKLRYQACNNRMCFRPATVDVRLPVLIE